MAFFYHDEHESIKRITSQDMNIRASHQAVEKIIPRRERERESISTP